eukprot:gnl/TRDRNA2_/TRDRNA2_85046_c0_seq1.p1 gnl/TRDRNA2_/TRDRNA2_85046_c0~~gnl/TRDRNA2_/TRDRNA2_85046_c0_seq1.p1  ORF type:complete len:898 (+),score=181.44 gnl/TRDRNA2_/TRDRNA2_85046_c0_seq1:42-2735(+)
MPTAAVAVAAGAGSGSEGADKPTDDDGGSQEADQAQSAPAAHDHVKRPRRRNPLPCQLSLYALYSNQSTQCFIASVIFLNFLQNAVKSQVMYVDGVEQTDNKTLVDVFAISEYFFVAIFSLELLLNMYAHFFLEFFMDAWNIFDLFIVAISLLSLGLPNMPGISVLRLFRALRAFRILKRIANLRVIVVGALRCLPGVANAFMIMALIMGIWSIMSVEFFGNEDFCNSIREDFQLGVECMDMFGQFSLAMLTMFQIATFDSWSSGITRPLVLSATDAIRAIGIGFFIISYLFVAAIILTNVVVAILLDRFLAASEELVACEVVEESPDTKVIQELANPARVKHRMVHNVKEIASLLDRTELPEELLAEVKSLERLPESDLALAKSYGLVFSNSPPDTPRREESAFDMEPAAPDSAVGNAGPDARASSGEVPFMPESAFAQMMVMDDDLWADEEAAADEPMPEPAAAVAAEEPGAASSREPSVDPTAPGGGASCGSLQSVDSTIADASHPLRTPSGYNILLQPLKFGKSQTMRLKEQTYWLMPEWLRDLIAKSHQIKLPYQDVVERFYDRPFMQVAVAGLIFANFFVSAVKAELHPLTEANEAVFDVFEAFFAFVFTVELVINMYGHFWWAFWKNYWNIFDSFIVTISLISVFDKGMPGIAVLRLFRAFRAFRLFKRIKSLRQIVVGVLKSLPKVSYAFVILGMIMGTWSIMAVDFFGKTFPREFGNFALAMLTMFQVMTFDSWSSGVARKVIIEHGFVGGLYFVTYVFSSSIIMMNVVIAILVDQFLSGSAQEAEAGENDKKDDKSKQKEPDTDDEGLSKPLEMVMMEIEHEVMSRLTEVRTQLVTHMAKKGHRIHQPGQKKKDKSALHFVEGLRSRIEHISTADPRAFHVPRMLHE